MYLEDDDGMGIELVFNKKEDRQGYSFTGNIPAEHSIRGVHHVELWVDAYEKTAALLTMVLHHRLIAESGHRFRYAVEDKPGQYIDLLWSPEVQRGYSGRGMVHHVALATPNIDTQLVLIEKLRDFGLNTTEIKERKYFTSIYFNEPNGIIIEIATSGPGFAVDEDISELGLHLQLPPQFEDKRESLYETLPQFDFQPNNFK